MDREPTPIIGAIGFAITVGLEHLDTIVSVAVGVCTLGFVVTRWIILVKKNGGFRRLFWPQFSPPSPAPAARRYCDECPRNPDQN